MKKNTIYSSSLTKKQIEALPSIFDKSMKMPENFKLTIEDNSAPEIVYHYTSMGTLHTILSAIETKNPNCFILRGTRIDYLNDTEEFKLGTKALARILQEYENTLPIAEQKQIAKDLNPKYWERFATLYGQFTLPFITSFSKNKSSLPMWNTYGADGKGVAIGIQKIKLSDSTYESKNDVPAWAKCEYDKELLENFFKKEETKLYSMFDKQHGKIRFNGFPNPSISSKFFSLLKHNAYEYEQEWRLIKSYSSTEAREVVKFQECNGLLKPFVEHHLPKNIIKEIVVGPTANVKLAKQSVEMYLQKAGYYTANHEKDKKLFVKIEDSKIPYRII